jgi:hypothetical protein
MRGESGRFRSEKNISVVDFLSENQGDQGVAGLVASAMVPLRNFCADQLHTQVISLKSPRPAACGDERQINHAQPDNYIGQGGHRSV